MNKIQTNKTIFGDIMKAFMGMILNISIVFLSLMFSACLPALIVWGLWNILFVKIFSVPMVNIIVCWVAALGFICFWEDSFDLTYKVTKPIYKEDIKPQRQMALTNIFTWIGILITDFMVMVPISVFFVCYNYIAKFTPLGDINYWTIVLISFIAKYILDLIIRPSIREKS